MSDSSENKTRRKPERVHVRILRQDGPGDQPYWEHHSVSYEPDMNVISVLQKVAAQAKTVNGASVAPVVWDCGCLEEVCGSCTMIINGRVRQSCSALVDRLLEEDSGEIELRPMMKFPVIRDLMVDRSRLFRNLQRVKAWVPVDGYYDMGPAPRISQQTQEQMYPLSQCMSCGCCLDACPQFNKIEVKRQIDETDESYQARVNAAYDTSFIGAHAMSQAMLFNMNPVGANIANERVEALIGPGGVQACGNAQNCVAVCPKEIPLTRSIAQCGRAATVYSIKKFFDR